MAPGCIGAIAMRGGGKFMGGEPGKMPIGGGGAQRSSMMGPLAKLAVHMVLGESEVWTGDWPIPGGGLVYPEGGIVRDWAGTMPCIWDC
jgi:hypothetical protein